MTTDSPEKGLSNQKTPAQEPSADEPANNDSTAGDAPVGGGATAASSGEEHSAVGATPEEVAAERPVDQEDRETPGSILARERQMRNLTQKDVADKIRLTGQFIDLIESDQYRKLPGPIFARGYIKNYSDLLGLDTDNLVARYDAIVRTGEAEGFGITSTSPPWYRNWRKYLIVVFLLLLVGMTLGLRTCNEQQGGAAGVSSVGILPTLALSQLWQDTRRPLMLI